LFLRPNSLAILISRHILKRERSLGV